MRALTTQSRLVEQVYEAILSEITEGKLPPNSRLIQDELAEVYGVSRQPVQQALLLLRNHGLVRDAPRRGLVVSPLDIDFVRNLYEIREVLEGLACRKAAECGPERAREKGPELIAAGREAVETGSVTKQIAADMAFHCFLYDISGNLLIAETMEPNWHYLRRVMGEVLRDDEKMPGSIWDEHAAILEAVIAGEADKVETLARQHISRAAKVYVTRLQAHQEAVMAGHRSRSLRRDQR
ncbi:GntR family transcriptional regulator [Skermanella aerolata]|nr:GntR family transcriptional regulator [Skermanella aerolata]KJB93144.1 GntR family transcriptional regulator [Skermanella aerolata KACC 11604]